MNQKFSRYTPFMERSFALRAFNNCETEINEHYWSFQVISEYSGYLARAQEKIDSTSLTATLFHATGPDAGRLPATVSDWLGARDNLEDWLRLSALASASSYLEVYLRQVTRSALMSDPLCRFGYNRVLDGIKLLKAGQEIPYKDDHEFLTKGDWSARSHAFKEIFGCIPEALNKNISGLEKIRKIRNNFAHGFGRDLDVPIPTNFLTGKSEKISRASFLKYIGIISKTAAAIDRILLNNFIGNFELVYFYHEWKNKPRPTADLKYNAPRALQRALGRDANCVVNTKFCSDIIACYDSI